MTHKQKVLALLSDGQPHSHKEGYALGVMLHSRIADLRRDGHKIDCWRDGALSMYRLVGSLGETSSNPHAGEEMVGVVWDGGGSPSETDDAQPSPFSPWGSLAPVPLELFDARGVA